jgi:hypothetical protein
MRYTVHIIVPESVEADSQEEAVGIALEQVATSGLDLSEYLNRCITDADDVYAEGQRFVRLRGAVLED